MRNLWVTEAKGGCLQGKDPLSPPGAPVGVKASPTQPSPRALGHKEPHSQTLIPASREFHTAERNPDPTEGPSVQARHKSGTHRYLAKAPWPWEAWSALCSPPSRLAPLCSSEEVSSWVEQVLQWGKRGDHIHTVPPWHCHRQEKGRELAAEVGHHSPAHSRPCPPLAPSSKAGAA